MREARTGASPRPTVTVVICAYSQQRWSEFIKRCQRRHFDATGYDTVEHGQVTRVSAGGRSSLYPYHGTSANMVFRADILRKAGVFDPLLWTARRNGAQP